MKKSKWKVAIAIVACFAMFATTTVSAKDFTSGGQAGFTSDGGAKPVDPENPDKPGPEDPGGSETGDKGKISLDWIPSFNFGTGLKVDLSKTTNEHKQVVTSMDKTNGGKYNAPFIQVTDARGPNKYDGWEVGVSCSTFKITANSSAGTPGTVLTGTEIRIEPGTNLSQTVNDPITDPTNNKAANVRTGTLTLPATGAAAQTFFSGGVNVWGTWINRMFDPAEAKTAIAADGEYLNPMVQLSVKSKNVEPGASYEATLTWTRTDAA